MNQLISEMCPSCMREAELMWDVERYGYKAYCPYCGERLMLCSVCPATADECCCDYDTETGSCCMQKK